MYPPTLAQKQRACHLEIDGRKGCFLLIDFFGEETIVVPGRGLPATSSNFTLSVDPTINLIRGVKLVWCFLDEMHPDGKTIHHFVDEIDFDEVLPAPGTQADPNRRKMEPAGIWEACEKYMLERALGQSVGDERPKGL